MKKEDLKGYLKGIKADYAEIRVEETTATSVLFRGKSFESIKESELFGGCVRVLKNGGWGFVSFNTLDGLDAKIQKAVSNAEHAGKVSGSEIRLADVKAVDADVLADIKSDPRLIPLGKKVDMTGEYGKFILSKSNLISSAVVGYSDSFSRVHFANSEGAVITQEILNVGIGATVVAVKNGVTQMNSESFRNNNDYDAVLGKTEKFGEMCDKAIRFLDADVVKGGTYDVICAPSVTGVFIHEAFGHLSEGDRISKSKDLQKVMVLGREFGLPILNVYDTGLENGKYGYIVYDNEGVPAEKTYLIREGKLVGRLHSRQTAWLMKERPTGSARSIGYKYPPIPRMRTTAIEVGKSPFDELLSGIKLGIYAKHPSGGQTGGEMFTFTTSESYMIRDGKICEPVRDVTLSGNVFQTLNNIDRVGNDYSTDSGGCGKGEQYPLPVSDGGPSIRIRNVVVGGR